jgi:hypothetical protein
VLFLDFSTIGNVSALPSGHSVGVYSTNFEIPGYTVWSDSGRDSEIYSESISDVQIPLVNVVVDSQLAATWDILAYHSRGDDVRVSEDKVDNDVYVSSSDRSFPGEYFIGRFATVYEKGIMDVVK